ncbi:MAG: hypothetical protein EBR09_15420 [Proteobacteria bacterium]|nr:hypothetical protein [Pseudomonadota bacterium]
MDEGHGTDRVISREVGRESWNDSDQIQIKPDQKFWVLMFQASRASAAFPEVVMWIWFLKICWAEFFAFGCGCVVCQNAGFVFGFDQQLRLWHCG